MKKRQEMRKRCQALVLAGILGAGTLGSAYTAYAAGPGEMPASVGASAAGGPGETGGSGGTGNVPSASSTSENAKGADQTNPNAWKKVNGVYQMPDGSAIQNVLARGIDVSRWQGEINWSQVAADDVSFVMLGTRSKGVVDPYFHRNIQQASAAGVKVGVYIYSLAVTVEMAEAEADFVLDLIHDYPVSYPVAFDMEDSTQGNLSKEELAAIANAFCKKISDSGYYPIVYANENWLKNKLDMSLMDYPVWVARYSARPSYQNPVMWQATSTGSVKGINGNVDIDFQFKDFSGQIPANTWRTINGKRYYYSNYAKQKNAWAQDSSDWYYMDSEGLASTGWITVSGSRYYLDETTGKMQTGWRQDQGKWYYLGSSGAVKKGWIEDNGAWYYTDSNGIMQTGWLDADGKRYYMESSGKMAVGWTNQNGKWYYLDASGALAKGWIQDNGSWYCSDTNGVMQTGWLSEGGKRYYLKGSGVMATGWREMDGAWYYFDGSGAMTTGMIEVNGLHYYMDPSTGRMAAGQTLEIGGAVYEAAADGHLIPQGQEESGSTNQESASDSAGTASGSSGTSSNPIIIPSNGSGNSSSSQNVPEPSAPVTGINGGPGVSSAPSQGQVAAGEKPGV
ncbi:GH25 family lysozyme [Clostridium sp. AT4]|jgi:glucan-binding YG repeat protein|uniref:GH25 family lysozyme n=1 Tax=Clostridium sp. AT4 TaxID=1720194 RepID=UPI00082B870C|nr:GH25 family lysozyme [Clostridium sp. AT4]